MIWFGVINAGTLVLGYLTAEVMGRRLDVSSVSMAARALFVLDALTIAGVLVFALTGSLAFAIGAFRAQARRAPLPGVAQPGARTRSAGPGHLAGQPGQRARLGSWRARDRGRRHPQGHPRSAGRRRDHTLPSPLALRPGHPPRRRPKKKLKMQAKPTDRGI